MFKGGTWSRGARGRITWLIPCHTIDSMVVQSRKESRACSLPWPAWFVLRSVCTIPASSCGTNILCQIVNMKHLAWSHTILWVCFELRVWTRHCWTYLGYTFLTSSQGGYLSVYTLITWVMENEQNLIESRLIHVSKCNCPSWYQRKLLSACGAVSRRRCIHNLTSMTPHSDASHYLLSWHWKLTALHPPQVSLPQDPVVVFSSILMYVSASRV